MTFLFNKLVPLIKCESADMRDTIVNGLGYVNPAVLRYALYIFVFKVLHSLVVVFNVRLVSSAWSFVFFSPATAGNDLRL